MPRKRKKDNQFTKKDFKLEYLSNIIESLSVYIENSKNNFFKDLSEELGLVNSALKNYMDAELKNYMDAEAEKQMLFDWLAKIYKEKFLVTDRLQDTRDLLKGFIYYIDRSIKKYPWRWNEGIEQYLEEQRKILTRLEYEAELEFWIEFDK